MKFDNENDLKVYQDAKEHRDYQVATKEQTAGKSKANTIIHVLYQY